MSACETEGGFFEHLLNNWVSSLLDAKAIGLVESGFTVIPFSGFVGEADENVDLGDCLCRSLEGNGMA